MAQVAKHRADAISKFVEQTWLQELTGQGLKG